MKYICALIMLFNCSLFSQRNYNINDFFDYNIKLDFKNEIPNANFSLSNKKSNNESMNYAYVKGFVNYAPVDLVFDKERLIVRGYINLNFLWLETNSDNKIINGIINKYSSSLKFEDKKDYFYLKGTASGNVIEYKINWDLGSMDGRFDNSQIKINFKSLDYNDSLIGINGFANDCIVDLLYDVKNKKIFGKLNNSPVEIESENLSFKEFLKYFFVFLYKE